MIPVRAITAAAIKSRSAWEAAGGAEPAVEFTDFFRAVWDEVSGYYARDAGASSANLEMLNANLARKYTNPKHTKAVLELVAGLVAEPVSPDAVLDYLRAEKRDRAGAALAAALAARRDHDEVSPLLAAYNDCVAGTAAGQDGEPDVSWAEAIRSRVDRRDRIQVTPRALNDRLGGGLLPGNNVILFGRPESGKTAFAITMACGFARRGRKVLFISNEDAVQASMMRAVSNLTDMTADQIAADPTAAEELALRRGAGKLLFKQLAPGTLRELDTVCKTIRPDILVVDQMRNITAKGAESFTQCLDTVARGIRAIGIRYHMVTVSITQAGDSASGKSILQMGDVDNSNTGVPAAADVLIGIGVTDSLEAAGMRKLSILKNKLNGEHAALEVRFNGPLSKFTS